MCHMYGPEPKAAFVPTKEDQDKATESMRKFYAPQGEDARRLARYDEAIRLLREAQGEILEGVDMDESQTACDIEVFLDAEGKVAG